jgi:hypothetical protein
MMKNIFTLITVITLITTASYAQTTPGTAKRFYGGFNATTLPAIGTKAPAGLGYECSYIHSRPTFLLISPCVGGSFSFKADANGIEHFDSTSEKDTLSVVLWGPFNDTANISSKLNNSNIAYCNNVVGSEPFNGLEISLNGTLTLPSKSFYYAMLAASDSVTQYDFNESFPSNNIVLDSPQCSICHGVSSNLTQNICVVTLDSATGKNEIIWDKNDPNVSGYIIYRQGASFYQFDSIGYLPVNALSIFVDSSSVPAEKMYSYELGAVDSCGQVFNDGLFHTTIHLASSPGINGDVNLLWNYYGTNGTFTYTTFYIYRGPVGGPLTVIDSLPLFFEYTSYTDLNPLPGTNVYQVGIRRTPACTPTFGPNGIASYTDIRSNFTSVIATGISSVVPPADVRLMPNPVQTEATLQLGSLAGKINTIHLYSLSGICLSQLDPLDKKQVSLSISNLPAGIYTLALISNNITYRLKLVKI